MAEHNPLWLQNKGYPAKDDRQLFEFFAEGIIGGTDLKVTQRGAGANASVDVAAGRAVVTGDDTAGQGKYLCYNDGVVNVAVPSNASGNPRIDLIVFRVYDKTEVPAHAVDQGVIELVQGSPAASPAVPAIPNSALVLAQIAVASGFVSITNANITDRRVISRLIAGDPIGSILESASPNTPAGYLLTDGTAVSRSVYSALFAEISTIYGVGDSTSTFNIPDYRGRFLMQLNLSNANTNLLSLNDGLAAIRRQAKHGHSLYDPGHSHIQGDLVACTAGAGNNVNRLDGSQNQGTTSSATGVLAGMNNITLANIMPMDTIPNHIVYRYIKY